MTGYALLIQHRTLPGKRDEVEAVWRKHMRPAITANPAHLAYFYCFGAFQQEICAFQHYTDAKAATAFLKTPYYTNYLSEVAPLLLGEPVVTVLDIQWSKDS